MATGSVVKQAHDCTVTITDGAALSQAFGLFTGSVSIGNVQRKRRNVAAYQVRGRLTAVRHTDLAFPTFTLTFQGANFTGTVDAANGSEISPIDVFNRSGSWVAATSTLDTSLGGGDVFCVDIAVNLEGTDLGDSSDHTLTLRAVHGVPTVAIEEPYTIQVECTCYGDIAGDLSIVMPDLS